MRRFEKSTHSEQAAHGPFALGGRALTVWLLVTAVFLAAAALSLFTGMTVHDRAAGNAGISRPPVTCGSVMRPARWSEDKWDESAVQWRTRVCDNARISRLGWTGVFVIGGLAVLVTGLGVCTWQRSRTETETEPGPRAL